VLGRGDVADEIRAIAARLGGADGGGDVVEAGGYVGGDWAEHVVGGTAAHPLLQLDVPLDLVQGNVARTFHQHLAPHLPADLGQFAVYEELLYLGPVGRIVDRSGPQAVAEGEDGVVPLENGNNPVELLVERVFTAIGQHPGDHGDPTLADQATVAVPLFPQPLDGVEVDAAVHRHEGHAVGALLLDQIEEHLLVQPVRVAVLARCLAERLVEGDVPHRQIHGGNDLAADPVQVAADGELHQGIRPGLCGSNSLANLGGVVDDVA